MPPVATGRPGRPAASTPEAALELARERFLAGERIDVQGIARELGLARATMHRWFQTRELLLGDGADRLLAALTDYDAVYFSGITLAVLAPAARERLRQVLLNLGGDAASIPLQLLSAGAAVLASTHTDQPDALGAAPELQPLEGLIVAAA